MKTFDVFPFFNELDVLEIRLNELSEVVDQWIILESQETYGGKTKPLHLIEAIEQGRFAEFHDRISAIGLMGLSPPCTDRTSGRLREAFQRNHAWPMLEMLAEPDDLILFSDCDEIPSAKAIKEEGIPATANYGIHRLKQRSYYYTANWLINYGDDFASRARIGRWKDVQACGSMYDFRMHQKDICPSIEDGGWHFSYFGGLEKIKLKTAALSPFLSEYRLFGDPTLMQDIINGRDLHHRKCELPKQFKYCPDTDPNLPKYLRDNREKFANFFLSNYIALP